MADQEKKSSDEKDEVESRRLIAPGGETEDDTEGHRHARQMSPETDDDVEGHRHARQVSPDEDDVEGHQHRRM
jgi:hypothetical protein